MSNTGCLYWNVCLTKDCSCRLDSHITIDQDVWNNLKAERDEVYNEFYYDYKPDDMYEDEDDDN